MLRYLLPSPKRPFLLSCLFFVFLLCLFPLKIKDGMVDFRVDYKAGQRLWRGETLYRVDDGHFRYKYAPAAAVLEAPFSRLPLEIAKFVFYMVLAACIVGIFATSYTFLPAAERSLSIPVFTFLILAKYLFRELYLGQINVIITLLLLLMIRCLNAGVQEHARPQGVYAGGLWAVATILKPHALIFLPYLMVRQQGWALLSGLCGLALAFWVPVPIYGFAGNIARHQEWLATLSQSTPELLSHHDIISIINLWIKWTGQPQLAFWLSLVVIACLAAGVLMLIFKTGHVDQPMVLEGAVLLTLIPLITPLGWYNMLLMSVLGIMLVLHHYPVWSRFWRMGLVANLCIIALSIYDLMGNAFYHWFMEQAILTLSMLFLVGYLASLRWQHRA